MTRKMIKNFKHKQKIYSLGRKFKSLYQRHKTLTILATLILLPVVVFSIVVLFQWSQLTYADYKLGRIEKTLKKEFGNDIEVSRNKYCVYPSAEFMNGSPRCFVELGIYIKKNTEQDAIPIFTRWLELTNNSHDGKDVDRVVREKRLGYFSATTLGKRCYSYYGWNKDEQFFSADKTCGIDKSLIEYYGVQE